MELPNLCPKCKASVAFEYIAAGKSVVSVDATCSSCGAKGAAAVADVSVAQFKRRPPSAATRFAILSAHAAAVKNIG